ncbi:hypothetical protein [Ramlibacter algicola]|uniref:Uncharacterized protein n=1 Tax=Ramlibacter algicola TaxID=2795217 RepID=A0A934PYG3_9BURK|nr:hypothetical protein [Ramlibacter algicola]MBK0392794.1 hypothetical protein [Ramlibacter algicola]
MSGHTNRPARALLAYCALAERLSAPKASPISALIPFLAPVCAARQGKLFDANEFATDVAARYGLHLPRLAALALTESLSAEGLLEPLTPGARNTPYVYRAPKQAHIDTADAVTEEQINALLARFVAGCRSDPLIGARDASELEEGFLSRLINADSMRILSRREGYSELKRSDKTLALAQDVITDGDTRSELHLDYAVSEFLLELSNTDTAAFEIASNVAFSSMAAEAIACFQEPNSAGDLSALSIVLDSPLLLDMLGVNSEYEEYGKELLEVLKSCGAAIVTFDHSINEAETAIHAQLEYLRSGVNRAGNAISTTAKPDLLSALVGNVARRCEERLGIEVVRDPESNLHKRQVAAVGNVQALMDDRMSAWGHDEAKAYDQKTIWHFLHLRDTTQLIDRICESKWIFLSRNTALVNIANDAWRGWLRDQNRHSHAKIAQAAPLALTDKQFAGYVWLRAGGKDGEIPKKRLLAYCSAAVRPRADIKARAYNLFFSVHGKEQASDLIVLMEDREGAKALMRATHGDPLDVTPDRLAMIFEQVKLAAGEFAARRAREEANQKLQVLETAHASELERLSGLMDDTRQNEAKVRADSALALAQAEEEKAAIKNQVAQLSRSLAEIQVQSKNRELTALREALQAGSTGYRTTRWLITILLTVFAGWGALISSDSPGLSALIAVVAYAAAFWFVPTLFEPFARAVGFQRLTAVLSARGIPPATRDDVQPEFQSRQWNRIDMLKQEIDELLSTSERQPTAISAPLETTRIS